MFANHPKRGWMNLSTLWFLFWAEILCQVVFKVSDPRSHLQGKKPGFIFLDAFLLWETIRICFDLHRKRFGKMIFLFDFGARLFFSGRIDHMPLPY